MLSLSENLSMEIDEVRQRYERREWKSDSGRYNPLHPAVYMTVQERQRALIRWIKAWGIDSVKQKRVLEIGCGSGSNLLHLILLGFLPENLVGNELLEDRARLARQRLPSATKLILGDASQVPVGEEPFDVVYQSTVFTSILDTRFQHKLADRMWALTRAGGGILWYDFTFDNPKNADVRGLPLSRIRELFPKGEVKSWRVTLAPPISRRVTAIHPLLYTVFNGFPFLRTHLLCWIMK